MIFEKLRERTAENHRMVEESGLMLPISNKTVTLDQYKMIISKFYGYFYPLEKKIEQIAEMQQHLPDLHTRRKATSLMEDMYFFDPAKQPDTSAQCCTDLPDINSVASAFGALYVMEGSSLGAKLISKILKETLQLDQNTGAAFFNAYGEETGAKWKAFKEHLTLYISSEYGKKQEEVVIETADVTFKKFHQWIMQ